MKYFNPQCLDHFSKKPIVIQTFESFEELDFNPNIIAKFQFPESAPWTNPIPIVNLTLSHVTKDQTYPSIYTLLHNEVKACLRDYDAI